MFIEKEKTRTSKNVIGYIWFTSYLKKNNYLWNGVSVKLSLLHGIMRQSKRGNVAKTLNFSQGSFGINQSESLIFRKKNYIKISTQLNSKLLNCTLDGVPRGEDPPRRLRPTLFELCAELPDNWPYTAWTNLYSKIFRWVMENILYKI